MNSLEKRIEALERKLSTEPIILTMPNGSTRELRVPAGRGDYVLDLLAKAVRGEHSPELDLIAQSVRSTEPGGGQMVDLVRALLNGPVEAGQA